MKKKNLYVVTVTYLDLLDNSVSTFVEGYSEELSDARAILDRDRIKKIEIGYLPDCFELAPWQWTYKHKYGSVKCEIHLVGE